MNTGLTVRGASRIFSDTTQRAYAGLELQQTKHILRQFGNKTVARRQAYSPPQSANLSAEQMISALPRLEKRISDLRGFDPTGVTNRNDPRINTLENAIDDFLTRTFGGGTVEYKRYRSAAHLDTASIFVGTPTPLHEVIEGLQHGKERAIEVLEGIRRTFREEIDLAAPAPIEPTPETARAHPTNRDIFVVHGRDHGVRDAVARVLDRLDLNPVILDEEASKSRTIHQKFLDHSAVDYAVVLFTPDDVGAPANDSTSLRPRPRQNVLYELGFFSAKLGHSNVCVLYSDGVEIPSDLTGVIYVPLDDGGAWHLRLAKEIKAAGIEIDMNKA